MTTSLPNKQITKRGVNIDDYVKNRALRLAEKERLAKAGAQLIRREIQPALIPVKEASFVAKKVETKPAKITPKPPIFEKPKMFRFVEADGVRQPQKLLAFIDWCAFYGKDRSPKTQKELGDKIGVDANTFSDWKRLVGFWDEVTSRREQFIRKFTTKIAYALAKRASTGDPKAVELWYTLFEGYKRKVSFDGEVRQTELNPAETEKIRQALTNIGLASILEINKPDEIPEENNQEEIEENTVSM